MGQILLVFNPIVSVVFTATAFLPQKAMQLFCCCNPLKDKLSGGFTVKYYLTKKQCNKKLHCLFKCFYTHQSKGRFCFMHL